MWEDLGGDWVRDAQADVPSAEWLQAQLAFKDSMVHGILQFTPSIAFRYVLHRCESRDIRCRESLKTSKMTRPCPTRRCRGHDPSLYFLGAIHAGVRCVCRERTATTPARKTVHDRARPDRGGRGTDMQCPPPTPVDNYVFAGRSARQVSTMILPQVHLRKPCYDFSFL